MRILDLDLDFFLSDIEHWRSASSERPSVEWVKPWTEGETRAFLEQQCGLDRGFPIPGKVVVEHDEVFLHWRDQLQSGRWIAPFEVVHVDAHADLGMGDASYEYIMTRLLAQPVEFRPQRSLAKLAASNYLAFAIACRWMSQLTYVWHPKGGNDVPGQYVRSGGPRSERVQLKRLPEGAGWDVLLSETSEPLALEPEIPFERIAGPDFRNDRPFTYVCLAQSPAYTPPEADALIEIIREYMLEE